jgi:hypothetical protein
MDLLSFILIVVGGIIVYGAKYILRFLKIDNNGTEFNTLKLIGAAIAVIGVLIVIDVI